MTLKAVAFTSGGGGGGVSGTGTANTIPMWTAASTLGNSAISQVAGAIQTLTLTNAGAGATNGTYSQQALTGGTGTGATADIVVAGNVVTVLVLRSPGTGYTVGDTLSCATIGGGGFVFTVSAVSASDNGSGNVTATRIGAGTTTPVSTLDSVGLATIRKSGAYNYLSVVTGVPFNNTSFLTIDTTAEPSGRLTLPASDNGVVFGINTRVSVDASLCTAGANLQGHAASIALRDANAAGTKAVRGSLVAGTVAGPMAGKTISLVYGLDSQASVTTSGGGNIISLLGSASFTTLVTSTVAETITERTGILITGGTLSGAAHSVANNYSLRLTAPSLSGGSTITNRWGISQEDALATNYFAGNVGVNTTTPKDRLHVANGSVKVGADAIDSFLSFGDEGVATRNNGIYRPASSNTLAVGSYNQITFNVSATTLGSQTNRGTIDATQASFTVPVRATGTSASAVAFSGAGDADTGMYFPSANTVRVAAGASIGMEIDSNGVFGINNGFGSIAPAYGCRAWVNFDSTVSGTWAGGASTVTRAAGSTTATVTTTNNHGLITGNSVYALSGVAVGYYTVTVTGLKTFTITTVATTALSAVAITFAVNNIRASGGVSSVTDISTGIFSVNFSTAMPDINYSAIGTKQNIASNSNVSLYDCLTTVGSAPGRTTTQCGWQCIESAVATDSTNVNIAVFR